MRIAVPDLVTNSYFPALAAEELGHYAAEGLEAHVELLGPAPRAMAALREGEVDAVAAGAHAPLTVFPQWQGAKLVVALAQGTPWLLVLHAGLPAQRGDLSAVKGLRLGAAPGPDVALRRLLSDAGIDPARDGVRIGPVPGMDAPDASFGVLAAEALEAGHLDGFWANALSSETAVRRGVGKILADVRRGDSPPAARHYTFSALVTTEALITRDPAQVAAAVRAIVRVQRALRVGPQQAAIVGSRRFPPDAAAMIATLVEQDLPFYDPAIAEPAVAALNAFAHSLGLLTAPVPYEQVVATHFRPLWHEAPQWHACHRTIAEVGRIGGGHVSMPGDVSLAHHGVRFLDEQPEFRRHVLEVLRQPLEDGVAHTYNFADVLDLNSFPALAARLRISRDQDRAQQRLTIAVVAKTAILSVQPRLLQPRERAVRTVHVTRGSPQAWRPEGCDAAPTATLHLSFHETRQPLGDITTGAPPPRAFPKAARSLPRSQPQPQDYMEERRRVFQGHTAAAVPVRQALLTPLH